MQYSWQYDEFKSVGRDYSNPSEVKIYDASHADFRDIVAESQQVLEELAVGKADTLIDFGSGTGTFVLEAARRCRRVHAVDVSQAMLHLARYKAAQAALTNIEFHHAGFLTYEHSDDQADAIVSIFALHHLPDFWKSIALARLYSMLKPSGQLYIRDVVMESTNPLSHIHTFICNQERAGGDFLREDAEGHFREEYSTCDWIMDELLMRAGFVISRKTLVDGVIGTYWCTKGELNRE
ncbi:MAG: class I SAM-dependent methyltransferase [Synechococcales cyanobacterium C42_A2020_086]|jgi:ubiquinone/menaquinone biosynthesis C-methylase UbiE|nr:class I SAM-dependent methyltransferase [Synechococcales cyanobacterium C42_A2020_086]